MARSTNEKVNEHLQAALDSLERERGKIDDQIRAIRSVLGQPAAATTKSSDAEATSSAAGPVVRRRRRRKLSAEARSRIAAAQKKRWTEFRKKKSEN